MDYKEIYNKVMANLSSQFINNQLSQTQKTEVTQIIKNTQSKLDGDTFRVLGLDRGNKTHAEVLQTLQQYRDSGNMTAEQNQEIQQLAVDTQVSIIIYHLFGHLFHRHTYSGPHDPASCASAWPGPWSTGTD